MPSESNQPVSPEALQRGYESHGVNYKGLMIFLLVFILTAVVLHAGLWFLLKFYLGMERAADVPPSGVPVVERFIPPRLQPMPDNHQLPWQDLADMRRHEDQVFARLGWQIDPATGQAIIPASVMEQLARRGGASATQPSMPTTQPEKGGNPP